MPAIAEPSSTAPGMIAGAPCADAGGDAHDVRGNAWAPWGTGSTRFSLLTAPRWLLDLLLPPQCLCCDARVEVPGLLCGACFRQVEFIAGSCCVCCGVPFAAAAQGDAGGICPSCRAAPPLFRRARAALRYEGASRQLILPLKHADRTELAPMLAVPMARAGANLLQDADALVPVPLHRRRLFSRRYNQAALLATAISGISGVPAVLDALVRRRATVPLGNQSAAEREATVRDVFALRATRVAGLSGRSIVLVDDVMTSGATANACAGVLLSGGARSVDVLVAARVPDPRLR